MSFYEVIHQERQAFEAKAGRRPTEMYLGEESYARLVNELRNITPPRFQHEYIGLESFDGMKIHRVKFEHDYIGFGL